MDSIRSAVLAFIWYKRTNLFKKVPGKKVSGKKPWNKNSNFLVLGKNVTGNKVLCFGFLGLFRQDCFVGNFRTFFPRTFLAVTVQQASNIFCTTLFRLINTKAVSKSRIKSEVLHFKDIMICNNDEKIRMRLQNIFLAWKPS